ncbi:MAG: flagellar hook-basal body complex protein FliE [Micavibrio aeruginosavorus]|uniref:Flagellar hook-basal body complex protein FliE n=1 Tax=Micavibrio aeruginosavorus TaxID=349221 RepID=A0A2W5FMM8_9BACT|nr:MAG: flagellar hook-basal body complex protein FliE [Micavibrio aeruginosavorus]
MQAASAYSNTAKQVTGSGESGETDSSSGGAAAGGGMSFGKMLEGAVKSSIDTVKAGEAASAAAVTGKANLLDVTQAVSAAKLTLETTVAVRDNVVDAYNKIMQMPI